MLDRKGGVISFKKIHIHTRRIPIFLSKNEDPVPLFVSSGPLTESVAPFCLVGSAEVEKGARIKQWRR